MKKQSAASRWHSDCSERDNFECRALYHDERCKGGYQVVHHIVFRAHLTERALWITRNGIALSEICHLLAHSTHNGNIADMRLRAAVDAVNAVQGDMPGQRVAPFYRKGIAS